MQYREEEIKEKIIFIVKEEMGLDLSLIDPDRDIRDQVFLDSMQLTELYAAVVEELNIQVPLSIMSARTFNEILKALNAEFAKLAV